MPRIIMLIDLDYFYAQCEILRRPELKGRPVVVCVYSGRSGDSGAVGTASYEARKLGIKSGIPISRAKSLADKDTAFLPVDMEYYRSVSERVMETAGQFADSFEQVSVDECYIEVSLADFEQAIGAAGKIKQGIMRGHGLTCSIGIGPNKLMAKMAAGVKKPDGLFCVRPEEVKGFLHGMKVGGLFSVGPKTEAALLAENVKTVGELAAFDVERLTGLVGRKRAEQLHGFANGIDERPVQENERQQLSKLGTLPANTRDPEKIHNFIDQLCSLLEKRTGGVEFKTVSFIAIATGLETMTRSRTLDGYTSGMSIVSSEAKRLADGFLKDNPGVVLRRAGVRVSTLKGRNEGHGTGQKQRTLGDY